jgi:hypothetical protein
LPLCCDTEELSFVSPGYPMYFQYIRFCLIFLATLFLADGIYSMYDNYQGSNCQDYLSLGYNSSQIVSQNLCQTGLAATFSLANIRGSNEDLVGQNYAVFACLVVLIFELQIMRALQRKTAVRCDERANTASDYAVMVYNFPKDFEGNFDMDQKVKEYFTTEVIPGRELTVKYVSCIYDCTEKIDLQNTIKNKSVEKLKLMAHKQALEKNPSLDIADSPQVIESQISQLDQEIK